MLAHLIGADVRRFRLPIFGWLLLEALVAALQVPQPSVEGTDALRMAASLLRLAEEILAIVLVVLVVQAHALVGDNAFWMTRPIPRSTLLASKLTLLGMLMIGIPVALELVAMTVAHVPAGEIARVVVQTTLLDGLWLAVVMAGAAITANFVRFATLVGAAMSGLGLWIVLNLAYLVIRPNKEPPSSAGPDIPDPTGSLIFVASTLVAASVLIGVQYWTRSRRRGGWAGGAAFGVALMITAFWPWPFLKPHLIVPAWARKPSALRLSADPRTVDFSNQIGWSENKRLWRTGQAKLWLGGLEPGWSATVGLLDASLELDSGDILRTAADAYASAVSLEGRTEHPGKTVLRSVLNVKELPAFNLPQGESATIFVVSQADFLKHASSNGTYHGRFRVNLTREEVAGVLPLRPGVVFQVGAYRLEIEDIVIEPMTALRLRGRQSNATSWFDRRPTSLYAFYLRNGQTSEAIAGNAWDPASGSMPTGAMSVSTFRTSEGFDAHGVMIRFPAHLPQGQSFPLTRSWLDRAELVIVRLTREGSVERTLSFNVALRPSPAVTGEASADSERGR
jgi:hypothetical protein